MAANFSTKLIEDMLGTVGLKGALTDFVIELRSGARSASADSADSGVKLVEITKDGGAFVHGQPASGLNVMAPSGGVVAKDATHVWRGIGLAAGTIGHARIKGNAIDAGQNSVALVRVDLTVAVSGADLNMSNLTVSVGSPHTIDIFEIAM